MKILITGSSGHLGEALVRTLRLSNHQVVGVDIASSEFTSEIGTIANRNFVKQCMKGVDVVIHTATLHKPHIVTHSKQDFIDTNVTATLNLLEESVAQGVKSFVFTSTTSTFGDALISSSDSLAVWVTEELAASPKNIYGVTKTAAEDLCELFSRKHNLACIVLKTSRFFPEEDDSKTMRDLYLDANIKANEFLFRRIDIEDVVQAHILAMDKAVGIGFGKYIISATSPFSKSDLMRLKLDAPMLVKQIIPGYEKPYHRLGWKMFASIGRVYVNDKARKELDWQPKYDFKYIVACLKSGTDYRSDFSLLIGSKGYHDIGFDDGPYPT